MINNLRRPVREEILSLLLDLLLLSFGYRRAILIVRHVRAPLEFDDAFHLNALLVHQAHSRSFIDADLLAGRQTGTIFVVGAPSQSRPWHFALCRPITVGFRNLRERPQQVTGLDFPYGNMISFVVLCEDVGAGYRFTGPCHEIILARRKVKQLHEWMSKARESRPRGTSPQSDTRSMKRGQVCSERRPAGKQVRPVLSKSVGISNYQLTLM